MLLPSRQGLGHAGAICMGMKLGRNGKAEGIWYYLLLLVAREQQQPPNLYNSGTWLLLERKVSKQLANCNSHCLLAIIRRTVINPNRWNSNGSGSLFFFFFSIPKRHLLWAKLRFSPGFMKTGGLWVSVQQGPCRPLSCIPALPMELVLSRPSQITQFWGWRVQLIALWFLSFILCGGVFLVAVEKWGAEKSSCNMYLFSSSSSWLYNFR